MSFCRSKRITTSTQPHQHRGVRHSNHTRGHTRTHSEHVQRAQHEVLQAHILAVDRVLASTHGHMPGEASTHIRTHPHTHMHARARTHNHKPAAPTFGTQAPTRREPTTSPVDASGAGLAALAAPLAAPEAPLELGRLALPSIAVSASAMVFSPNRWSETPCSGAAPLSHTRGCTYRQTLKRPQPHEGSPHEAEGDTTRRKTSGRAVCV